MKLTYAVKFGRALWLCVSFLFTTTVARAQTDGIFAEFNTSMGSFTCRVEYAKAPKAAASFIGLATGQRTWLDLSSGEVKAKPFYDGLIFHRVIAGFMIQGGSPNGQGTDGPGYSFQDEFDPTLRHDSFGVLSSANSGPDSNGSQFFVTVEPTSWLDDVHTIFGKVVGGSNVVYAINHVATDSNDKPLTNVVLQSLVIRRVGAAAEAFDINAQGLPDVVPLNTGIARAGTNVTVTFTNQLNVDNRLYYTTNLTAWSGTKLRLETTLPVTNFVTWPISQNEEFLRMAQVQYPDALYTPRNVYGETVTLDFGASGIIVIDFDASGGGSYTYNGGSPGVLLGYNWIQDPYRGRLAPIGFSGLTPSIMDLHLHYDSSATGTFRGTGYPNYPSSAGSFRLSGTFTSSP